MANVNNSAICQSAFDYYGCDDAFRVAIHNDFSKSLFNTDYSINSLYKSGIISWQTLNDLKNIA